MPRGKKTTDEQLEELRKRKQELEAAEEALVARKKAEDRALDTRRKIVVGAAAMAHARIDPVFRRALAAALEKAVAPKDRAVVADVMGRTSADPGAPEPEKPGPVSPGKPPEPRS